MLALTVGAAQELAKLHTAGWAHGDLQWPFTEFEEAIIACMAPDPRDRPTSEHVATALR